MGDKDFNLEQFLKEKENLLNQIEKFYFQYKLIFESKGIDVLLKKANNLIEQGFTAQEANDKLQCICRKTMEELTQVDTERERLGEILKRVNDEIEAFK